MSKYLTAPVPSTGMPKGVPFIIGNEAAERFSFYGMKTILFVFMTSYLLSSSGQPNPMEPAEARQAVSLFAASAYFFPILGAIVADAILGKYLTIMILSIVYCIGHLALALMDMPPAMLERSFEPRTLLIIGLALIALGSGGIKPCVSANVGDQFGESNRHLLGRVYAWFYFSINFGSLFSTLLTPWVLAREGPDLFLPWLAGPGWAFGIPGILMAVATICFWAGRKRFVHIQPQGWEFVQKTFMSRDGLGVIAKLVPVYFFVAFFWALYDQTGAAWVQQAETMDRDFAGITWLESQVQAVNPALILLYIPIFTYAIYPAIHRIFPLTFIRKIAIGFFITVAAFALTAWTEQRIADAQEAFKPQVQAAFADKSIDLAATMSAADERGHESAAGTMKRLAGTPLLLFTKDALYAGGTQSTAKPLDFTMQGPGGTLRASVAAERSLGLVRQFILNAEDEAKDAGAKATGLQILIFSPVDQGGLLRAVAGSPFEEQARKGASVAQVIAAVRGAAPGPEGMTRGQLGLLLAKLEGGLVFVGPEIGPSASISVVVTADGVPVKGVDLWSGAEGNQARGADLAAVSGPSLVGAVVQGAVFVQGKSVRESGVPNIAWQLLAFMIITAAEVMVSITCLEFSYTQAPPQMKSFVMGLFLLSVSAGNGIIFIVNRFTTDPDTGVSWLEGPSYYRFFTWMMLGASLAFLVVAKLYKPREYLQTEVPASRQRAHGDAGVAEA